MSQKESNIFNMRTVNYIISAVIIFVVIAAIYKVFNEIFNNAFMSSLADAAGSAAYGLGTLFDGCSPQTNCGAITNNPDKCKSKNDCSSDPTNGTCSITSNRKPGEGGFTSPSCGLGVGLIIYGTASFVLTLITAIATAIGIYKSSASVKQAESLGVGNKDEIIKIIKNELMVENLKLEKLKKEQPELKITEKDSKNVLKQLANDVINKINENKINTMMDQQKANLERVILADNVRVSTERVEKTMTPEEIEKSEEIKKLLPEVIL